MRQLLVLSMAALGLLVTVGCPGDPQVKSSAKIQRVMTPEVHEKNVVNQLKYMGNSGSADNRLQSAARGWLKPKYSADEKKRAAVVMQEEVEKGVLSAEVLEVYKEIIPRLEAGENVDDPNNAEARKRKKGSNPDAAAKDEEKEE